MRTEVRQYYERGGEDARLLAGAGLLEFLRTQDVLRRVLPAAPAAVIDCGAAGTGSTSGVPPGPVGLRTAGRP